MDNGMKFLGTFLAAMKKTASKRNLYEENLVSLSPFIETGDLMLLDIYQNNILVQFPKEKPESEIYQEMVELMINLNRHIIFDDGKLIITDQKLYKTSVTGKDKNEVKVEPVKVKFPETEKPDPKPVEKEDLAPVNDDDDI